MGPLAGPRTDSLADDSLVQFDVPAMVAATAVCQAETTADGQLVQHLRAPLTVSCTWLAARNWSDTELVVEVSSWQGNLMVIDYQPKTTLASDVEGLVAIERQTENSNSVGLDANAAWEGLIRGSAKANTGQRRSTTLRFQEHPEHQVAISSGTIHRATGAYFKFRPTRLQTLEGTHPIELLLEAPGRWRADLLRVDCRLVGRRQSFGSGREVVTLAEASFLVPIHLADDSEAWQAARTFALREQQLRRLAEQADTPSSWRRALNNLQSLVSSPTVSTNDQIQQLIVAAPHQEPTVLLRQLSPEIQPIAREFLAARREITARSR